MSNRRIELTCFPILAIVLAKEIIMHGPQRNRTCCPFLVVVLAASIVATANAQTLSLRPVSSTGPHVIIDDEIFIPPGGAIVDLEATLIGWSGGAGNPKLGAALATIDPASYLGANAVPANPGVDLIPLGYALPNPSGGNRSQGFFITTHVCSINERDCSPGQPACGVGEGTCGTNPRWVVAGCTATLPVTNTDSLHYEGGAVCKTPGGLSDHYDPNRGYIVTLRLVVPPLAGGTYVVRIRDFPFTFVNDGEGGLISPVVLRPAIITITTTLPPDPELAIPRNRYVSFAPQAGQSGAYRIELVSNTFEPAAVGFVGWVGNPSTSVPLGPASQVLDAPVFRDWTEEVVHIGDCEIMPGAEYLLSFTTDGVTFAPPVLMRTAGKPQDKDWCDVVGAFNGVKWPGPDGFANVHDLLAVLSAASGSPTPVAARANLRVVSTNDPCLLPNVNVGDIFMTVLAIGGQPYPFVTNPANCPPCS